MVRGAMVAGDGCVGFLRKGFGGGWVAPSWPASLPVEALAIDRRARCAGFRAGGVRRRGVCGWVSSSSGASGSGASGGEGAGGGAAAYGGVGAGSVAGAAFPGGEACAGAVAWGVSGIVARASAVVVAAAVRLCGQVSSVGRAGAATAARRSNREVSRVVRCACEVWAREACADADRRIFDPVVRRAGECRGDDASAAARAACPRRKCPAPAGRDAG